MEEMIVITVENNIKFLCELTQPITMTTPADTRISTFAPEATVGYYLQLKGYRSHLGDVMELLITDVEHITVVRNK